MYYIGSLFLSGYQSNGLPLCSLLRPSYHCDLCCPVSVLVVQHSAVRSELLVPRERFAIMQQRAFLVVGPLAWNDLPFELRSLLMEVLLWPWLRWERLWVVSLLKRRYIILENEWMEREGQGHQLIDEHWPIKLLIFVIRLNSYYTIMKLITVHSLNVSDIRNVPSMCNTRPATTRAKDLRDV